MKKILIAVLIGLAYRELHRDLEVRAANWGGKHGTSSVSPDRDDFLKRMNAAIDDPDHPSWAAIRAADKAREGMRKLGEERGDNE